MKKTTSIEMALSLGLYVKRWQRWVAAWLQGIAIIRHDDQRPHKPAPHPQLPCDPVHLNVI
jgi:hypothetical protein